jgi:hypothetical protein
VFVWGLCVVGGGVGGGGAGGVNPHSPKILKS